LFGELYSDADRAATEAELLSDLGAEIGGANPIAWAEPPTVS